MDKICPRVPPHFGPLMGYCDHQAQKLMGRMLRQYDVSPMQSRTLIYLHKQTGEVTQKMLEQFLMVKPSTVNGIVDRLEEKGLLRRTTSKVDGRYRILTLTEEGVHFYDDMIRVAHEVEDRMERGFTPEELDTLKSYLLRVADNLREEAGE
ncbi:MAG: MarR family transcriptional regulator [Oscillospiraceae bacterium]|nr:MarR family transcriptional regulator [Oscillospiraceae bacterium]